MRARQAWVGSMVLAALSGACGGGDDDTATSDAGASDAAIGPDAAQGPGLTGVLVDENGQELANKMVLACMAEVCLFGASGVDARFAFEIEAPHDVALKTTEDTAASPRRAAALCPVQIVDDNLIDVGQLHVPLLPAGVNFGPAANDPQVLALGDGLQLTLNRGDLTPRVGDTLLNAAARAVAPEARCPMLTVDGETVDAVYAIHPFGATSSTPIAVRVPSTLSNGTAVKFRSISEIDGTYSAPALGTVSGGFATTDVGQGLSELSWLIVSH